MTNNVGLPLLFNAKKERVATKSSNNALDKNTEFLMKMLILEAKKPPSLDGNDGGGSKSNVAEIGAKISEAQQRSAMQNSLNSINEQNNRLLTLNMLNKQIIIEGNSWNKSDNTAIYEIDSPLEETDKIKFLIHRGDRIAWSSDIKHSDISVGQNMISLSAKELANIKNRDDLKFSVVLVKDDGKQIKLKTFNRDKISHVDSRNGDLITQNNRTIDADSAEELYSIGDDFSSEIGASRSTIDETI